LLRQLLLNKIAGKTTFLQLEMGLAPTKFVPDATGDKWRRCNFRVRVLEFLAGCRSLVAENGDIPEAAIPFQVRDAADERAQNLRNVFNAQLREKEIMTGVFHDDFMSA